MEFIETPIFTRQIDQLLTPENYRAFQNALLEHPEAGAVIQGTNGARKLRWGLEGRGKSGGIRVIYVQRPERVYLLLAYAKNRKDNLTPAEKRVIADLVRKIR